MGPRGRHGSARKIINESERYHLDRYLSSGARTRTPNNWTRTSCVTDYTTPEGLSQVSPQYEASHNVKLRQD